MGWAWIEYRATLSHIGLLFNTLVHVVMYSYYLKKTLQPNKSIWWKPLVTLSQLVQFFTSFVLFAVTSVRVYRGDDCQGFKILLVQLLFNITLFLGFQGIFTRTRATKQKSI